MKTTFLMIAMTFAHAAAAQGYDLATNSGLKPGNYTLRSGPKVQCGRGALRFQDIDATGGPAVSIFLGEKMIANLVGADDSGGGGGCTYRITSDVKAGYVKYERWDECARTNKHYHWKTEIFVKPDGFTYTFEAGGPAFKCELVGPN